MTTETNEERLARVKKLQDVYYSRWDSQDEVNRLGKIALSHLDWLIKQAERAQKSEEELDRWLSGRNVAVNTYNQINQLNEENARLRSELSTVHVIKRRNGKATIIRWNDERYVYQSESSARGGVRHGKPNKGQTFKT